MKPHLSLCTLLLLAACQSTTIATHSNITLPDAYQHAAPAESATDIARWWRHWQDPVLTHLIENALASAPDLAIAQSRLAEARAVAGLAEADRGASAGLQLGAGHLDARLDNPLATPLAGDIKTHKNALIGGLNATWEADFFGQKQSDADAARYAALGAAEQAHGAQLLLAANLAGAYLDARTAQAQEKIGTQTVATLDRLLRYSQARFRAGHINAYEVGQIEQQLTAARAKHRTHHAEYARAVRQIAVLSGTTPQSYTLPDSPRDILARPPAPPQGHTPAQLIERRPDLRARAAAVHAHAAKRASAQADLYPRLTLNFLGQGVLSIDSDSQTNLLNLIGARLQVPLFTNGRIQANIDAADARLRTALLEYDQTLLQALADVDNAYHSEHALGAQSALLDEAQQRADKHARDADKLFRYGNKTLSDVLSAQLTAQQTGEQRIMNRRARAQALIALYQALGGGWTTIK